MNGSLLRSATVLVALSAGLAARSDDPVLRERARTALRKAVEFYRTKVSTQGGYHFQYTEDLSYGRSEMSEGPTRVEVQRDGTPVVGMAYLDAYEATRDAYYLEAARDVARALVRGQYCSGGWDYYIEFDPAKRSQFPYRADGRCESSPSRTVRPTTLDDNVTQAAVRLLMRVDRDLDFRDAPIHEAALFALDSLIKAQYPNGAWPQRYSRFPDPSAFPVKPASYPDSWPRAWPGSDYQAHYTFNDDSIVDMIDAMLEAARIYKEPRYLASAEKGGDFILLAQMPEPQPGWAQQYDRNMHPAWARAFEPPSVTGGEAQSVMRGLLLLFRETGKRKYLEPLASALACYRRSLLPDVNDPSEIRRRACPGATPCLARFAELKTNRPLYITKGTRLTALDRGTTNVDGYEVSYSDASHIVDAAVTTTALVSTVNPTVYGEAATFTVTVAAVAPGAGTPAGSVQFRDNGAALGPAVALSGGGASVTLSSLSAGTHAMTAEYAGDSSFNGGTSLTVVQTVNKASATIHLSGLSRTFDGSPKAATVWTDPAGLIGVSVVYNGSPALPIDAGSHTVVASLNNANYVAADATGTLVIDRASQTIAFAPLGDKSYGDLPFTVAASASSGLDVTFAASGSCSMSGTTVRLVSGGLCTVTAEQPGNSNYYPAPSVRRQFTVAYAWSNLLPPIRVNGTSIFKIGSTVPVKFQLTGASAALTNLPALILVSPVSNGVTGLELEAESTSAADSGNTFRYDAPSGQYIFNLATKTLAQGTWQIRIDLQDGSPHTVMVSLK